MPQFAVHRNPNSATRATIPLLLDVQSELLDALTTRVVIPLYRRKAVGASIVNTLMPEVELDGDVYVAVTPELAGIPRRSLGAEVGRLADRRGDIIAALDLLLTGI